MKATSTNFPDAIEITYHEENGYLYPERFESKPVGCVLA